MPLDYETDFMADVFNGTPKQASSGTEYSGWRIDFTPDSPTVVRARLRRGRGKNRNNVKDDSGTVVIRNYVPLGRIEDVESNSRLRQWHARCARYRALTGYLGGGARVGIDSGTPKDGVAQPGGSNDPLADLQRQEEWSDIRGGILGVSH